ncbi:MAG: UDP-N-acetylmuramoyl-L-alanyl-D-glutamate--2,6-diaminopimelate ligase [Desulfobacteraceae bacterium]|nr:UDP-N-acetylmuramoyl-L-alanyl-D-glutamate--2,6-diaminopimelate ligase [Desulfobacteraceae bacterium]
MKLSALIEGCALKNNTCPDLGSLNKMDISSISSKAQEVKPGGLFLAVKGYTADGHDYIDQAIANGAIAVIAQENPNNYNNIILVEDSRKAGAIAAANFYGQPSKDLTLVGITGTNGKTTTTWILESIFNTCGFNTGVIGTVNIRYKGKTFDNPVTTPDAIELQKTLFDMKQAGVTHVIMEVSSHGLDQYRVEACEFDAGVYTNLTQDHLDYHENLDEYFQCKKRFFTDFLGPKSCTGLAPAIINIDNDKGIALSQSISYQKFLVSYNQVADVSALDITDDIDGLSGTIYLGENHFTLKTSLTGKFNLENILCAAGAAFAIGIDKEKIQQGINSLTQVPGRMEKIKNQLNRYIFVDYAHTPDALESVLSTLAQRAPARLITVFGCGGNRDKTKRSPMGKIACKYSDVAIVTSDNPRNEPPEAIINDIITGIKTDGIYELDRTTLDTCPEKKGYFKESDRKKALEIAVMISRPSDIIVAAGKGHETYQLTNSGTIHFDDTQELTKACQKFETRFTPIQWSPQDLTKALAREPEINNLAPSYLFTGINTDSRTITNTQIFLALKGENFDGHNFISKLLEKGIQGFITQKEYLSTLDQTQINRIKEKKVIFFETDNTLTALGCLARYQRIRSNVKLVAITGSNGKTTTRKITQEIFKTQFTTLATKANFNNEIGMPLTLLNLSHAHQWAVIEMGMNHPGEILRLSQIACPDIAIITNTAGAHLEGLKNADNVARAKGEIFEHVRKNGHAIIFADDKRRQILEDCAKKNNIKTLYFGSGDNSQTRAHDIETTGETTNFTVTDKKGDTHYSINSPAPFMVTNALASITAAKIAKISSRKIKTGLAAFTPVPGRMKISQLPNGLHLIDDTYNANPASMTQALKTLDFMAKNNTAIAILGDMLELGKDSALLHEKIGNLIAMGNLSRLYLFGKQVAHIQKGALEKGFSEDKIFWGTKEEITQNVLLRAQEGDWILLKGSRSMAMETIISNMKITQNKEYNATSTGQ